MTLDWTTLALLCFAAAVAWFWQDSLAAREIANAAAREACERLSLQFLDGTVAFTRLGFTRIEGGRLALRRTYVFDYTANSIERREGFVVVTARRVETLGYAQEDAGRRETPMRTAHPPAREPAPVIRLDDFRRREPERANAEKGTPPGAPPEG
jgi:hypothetical protein